ncbi:LAMI_0F13982g1_1 [Lachancea mirantina]|uniref:LAMI_0F13982g1_1 n=1 Tax=Lachancea mirantina TaxID=1230905 RepID=A0A1G4K3N3_9SACH|nr:LAMI_0F13982g1_1 [Lachancea mirantina]
MKFKKSVTPVFLFLLLGAGLLTFFVILSGARETGVLKDFYWFEADTSGFNSAPNRTRWYNYQWCGVSNGALNSCSSTKPATPFSPRDNFGSSGAMPKSFLDNRNTYYYLSRVAWAMLLIGIFYLVCAIVPMIVSIFMATVVGSFMAVLSLWLATFFITLAACLYTGCYVKARNAFHDGNRAARLGPKNFGFIWTSVALLLACSIWMTIAMTLFGVEKYQRQRHLHNRRSRLFGHQDSGTSSYSYDKSAISDEPHGTQDYTPKRVFRLWRPHGEAAATANAPVEANVVASDYDAER